MALKNIPEYLPADNQERAGQVVTGTWQQQQAGQSGIFGMAPGVVVYLYIVSC